MATTEASTETPTPEAEVSKPDKPDHALSAETARWVADNARPREAACLCGCGKTTKTRFFPGHDALLKRSLVATVEKGGAAAKSAKAALSTFGW